MKCLKFKNVKEVKTIEENVSYSKKHPIALQAGFNGTTIKTIGIATSNGLFDFSTKMSDGELLCNYTKCRKVLTGTAYITRCSHAFCEEDGLKQIESQHFEKKCPACHSPLIKNYDLVKVTLNPNDQFKSMVLAGLRPDVVMDIATRAIMFWSYQQHQEQLHQTLISKNLKDIINQYKNESEVETGCLKREIQSLKRKQEDLQKELEKQNLKCSELSEKVALKTREIQKWQMMYESLRRKQLSAVVLQRDTHTFEPNPIALGPQTMDDLLTNRAKGALPKYQPNRPDDVLSRQRKSPTDPNDDFVFQPRSLTTYTSPKVFLENPGNYRLQNQRRYKE